MFQRVIYLCQKIKIIKKISKNTISFFFVQEFDVTLIEDGFSLKTSSIVGIFINAMSSLN